MKHDKYLTQRRNRLLQYFRLRLGVQQLINKPLLNILLILVVTLFVVLWKAKGKAMILFDVPGMLFPVYCFSVSFMAIAIPLLLLLLILETIGKLTARKDEVALLIAFEPKELRNGCPILISKLKESNATRREFYSDIPLHIWEKRENAIADAMNIRFTEKIRYGGRANGKRIVMYTVKSRLPADRGNIIDKELEDEIKKID